MFQVVNLSKDLENIIHVLSLSTILDPGFAFFDRREQFAPFINLERVTDRALYPASLQDTCCSGLKFDDITTNVCYRVIHFFILLVTIATEETFVLGNATN